MENVQIVKKRTFGGKTSNFLDKEERDFEQKHLQAYIKGKPFFRHRYKTITEEFAGENIESRIPTYFETKVNWV